MLIYLIRHGITALNEQRRYQGKIDEPLSQAGRGALCPSAFSPDTVWASPLRRAVETAEILFPHSRILPVEHLREMDFGAFEGRSAVEMEHDLQYRSWVDGNCLGRCPGGESREAFSLRSCSAFEQLVNQGFAKGLEHLFIVAHGGTQMAVLERWGVPRKEYYLWQTKPGDGLVLDAAGWPDALTSAGHFSGGTADAGSAVS